MRSLGLNELLVIMAIAVFLFGGKKIPEITKGIADGVKNFRVALRDEVAEEKEKKS